MQIADQVCSPEQAVYFAEAGLKLPATFFWLSFYDSDHPRERRHVLQWAAVDYAEYGMSYLGNPRYRELKAYPAYNCTELGAMLYQTGCYTRVNTVLCGWACGHVNDFQEFLPDGVNCYPTEAQARAAMLRHLLVQKLMPIPGIKEIMGSTP